MNASDSVALEKSLLFVVIFAFIKRSTLTWHLPLKLFPRGGQIIKIIWLRWNMLVSVSFVRCVQ